MKRLVLIILTIVFVSCQTSVYGLAPWHGKEHIKEVKEEADAILTEPPFFSIEEYRKQSEFFQHAIGWLFRTFKEYGIKHPTAISSPQPIKRDQLLFPDGPNIAMPRSGAGNAENTGLIMGPHIGANLILISEMEGSILKSDENPPRYFCRYGLFMNKDKEWQFGHFEKPLPLHASYDRLVEGPVPSTGMPVIDDYHMDKMTEDKIAAKQAMIDGEVQVPDGMILMPDRKYTIKKIINDLRKAFPDPPKAGYVLKSQFGFGGESVVMLGKNEEDRLAKLAKYVLDAGVGVIIEERVESLPLFKPLEDKLKRFDWNFRTLMSYDEKGKPYMSGLEVRYAPYGNEPVNVHLGAKEITWKTLSKWMRWSEHESKRRLKEVEDFSIAMLNASNKAIKKLDPKNNGGYYGMDCIWGKKGLYAMETNSGPGGIDYQLETATNEEDKIEALKPLFGRMARLAKKYRTKVRKLPADPDKWIIVKQTYKNFLSLSDMQKTNKDHIESARYFGKALEEGSSKDPFFWRLYGHKLIGLNDDKNALKAFRRAADLNPLDHDSYICLAETYIMLKNPKKALKATKRAMEINPISHFDRVVRAGALFAGGKDELAEESLKTARKLVAKEPKEAKEKFDNNLSRILSLVAMYFYEKKQYQRSHDFALRALKTIPDHKEVMARIKQYKPSRHINYFTFLRSISSSYNKYNYIKALIYLAVSNAALKKYKDSQKNYWLFLANNPNNIDMWINFAKTFEAQGDHEGAYMIIREAWRENPNTKKFWLHSGYYLSLMGRHDEAVISFMQGFSKISNLELLKPFLPRYVAEMRLSGQIQEAIATLEKFTRKYPDDISVWYQLALCYRHSGEFDALDDTAIQMMALDPDNPWGYIFKSHALIGRERMGEAYFYAGKVLSLESTLLDKRKRIYYDLANTLLQLGKLETAGLYYKTYCRLNKNDADALHRYIIVLSNLNDTKEALKFARRLMKIAPEDPRGWLHLAVHYWYNGKKRKAFEYFEKSFSLDPDKTLTKKFFHRYYASIPKKLLKNYLPIKRVLAKYIGIKTTMVPSPDTDIFLMLADTAGLIVRPPEKAQKQVDEDSVLLAERSL